MNVNELLNYLNKTTNLNATQTELARALGKNRSNINAKAKRGTELKYSEIKQIEEYFKVKIVDKTITKNNCSHQEFNLDETALTEIICGVEEFLETNDLKMPPVKKAKLIITIYKMFADGTLSNINKSNIIQFCRIAS